MANYISGVNTDILIWARERSGYSVNAIADKLKKDKSIILEWESGERALTYVQLETLAGYYKRPVAIFFFPEIPQEANVTEKLSLRKTDIESLNPRVHILFRQAYLRQLSLMELNLGVNSSEKIIFREINAQLDGSPIDLAKETRNYLNVTIDQQIEWKDPIEALKSWRECLEDNGLYIFKESFKDESVDGFCLLHDEFPVIFLNNNRHPVRQIFSLFHELAHILLGQDGVTFGTKVPKGKVERYCNQFAAEFLLPSNHIKSDLDINTFNDDIIHSLSDRYKVSRPVILIKLSDLKILNSKDYRQLYTQWIIEQKKYIKNKTESSTSAGGNYYYTQAEYLGTKYMSLAFSHYYQGHSSIEQLSEYLDVKVKQIPHFEERLLSRITR